MKRRTLAPLGLLFLPLAALGHHSFAATFDLSRVIELEGEVTRVLWRNPHIGLTLRTIDDSGAEAIWNLESQSLSVLRRMEITEPFFAVGDMVKVAGYPARRAADGLFVTHMLLPGGEEFVFQFGSAPAALRWSDRAWGDTDGWFVDSGVASEPERGLFRVWATTLAGGGGFFWRESYPLTDAARDARAAWDHYADDPITNCAPKGMPAIMSQPYPLEFVEQGDTIMLRLEEYDTVRTIHLDDAARVDEPPPSLLGHSVGHWDDNALVVKTTGVDWGHFDAAGIRLSADVEILERFTPAEDGSRLDYELTILDATTFTEPVVLRKAWVSLPGLRVAPYECTIGG